MKVLNKGKDVGGARGGKGRFEVISRRLNAVDLGGKREKCLGRFPNFLVDGRPFYVLCDGAEGRLGCGMGRDELFELLRY